MQRHLPTIIPPLAIVLLSAVTSHGFYEIGRGEIFLETRASVAYESNIFENRNNTSDVIFRLNPELQYLRRAGRYNVDAHLGAAAQKFLDNDREDSVDLTAGVSLSSAGERQAILSPTFRVSIDSRRQAIGEVGVRARTDTFSASTGLSYQHSDRVVLNGSLNATHTRFSGGGQNLSDTTTLSMSEQITYIQSARISYFAGHTIAYSFSSGADGRGALKPLDNTVFVGVGGQISPKVSGSAQIGYTWREFLEGDIPSTGSIFASGSLNWQATDRRSYNLTISRALGLGVLDQSTETTTVSVGVNQTLTDKISASAGASHSWQEFSAPGVSRTDKIITFNTRVNFALTRQASASAGYSYTQRNSADDFIDSHTHRFDVTATYRF